MMASLLSSANMNASSNCNNQWKLPLKVILEVILLRLLVKDMSIILLQKGNLKGSLGKITPSITMNHQPNEWRRKMWNHPMVSALSYPLCPKNMNRQSRNTMRVLPQEKCTQEMRMMTIILRIQGNSNPKGWCPICNILLRGRKTYIQVRKEREITLNISKEEELFRISKQRRAGRSEETMIDSATYQQPSSVKNLTEK